MIQKFLIIMFFAGSVFSLNAQKLKDDINYQITYKLTFQIDSTDVNSEKSEYMYLFLGDEYSHYQSRAKTLTNRIVRNGNSAHTARAAITNFHYEIVKNFSADDFYYLLKIPKMNDYFYYVQKKDLFNWKIEGESKSIKGYKVQKATTTFGGREYIAWFAPEIPISDGPYKFNGLPGLILEIHDSKKYWNFEFYGLKKKPDKKLIKINLNQYIKTSQVELEDLWYRYRRDPMGYANNPNVVSNPEVNKRYVESFTKILEKENNPLELD